MSAKKYVVGVGNVNVCVVFVKIIIKKRHRKAAAEGHVGHDEEGEEKRAEGLIAGGRVNEK